MSQASLQRAWPSYEPVCDTRTSEAENNEVEYIDEFADRLETGESVRLILGREQERKSTSGHGKSKPCLRRESA